LPQHVDRVCLLGGDPELAEGPLYAVVTPNPRAGNFDAEIVDSKGNCYLQLHGYRTIEVPGGIDAGRLRPLQAAMSLEAVVA
jgi:hypothetical protein